MTVHSKLKIYRNVVRAEMTFATETRADRNEHPLLDWYMERQEESK